MAGHCERTDLFVVTIEQTATPGLDRQPWFGEQIEQVLGNVMRMGRRLLCGAELEPKREGAPKGFAAQINEPFEQLNLDLVLVALGHRMFCPWFDVFDTEVNAP
jgi:hypothetical protein